MRHILFAHAERYPIAVLVKGSAFSQNDIQVNYIAPLGERGIPATDLIAFSLAYDDNGKAPVKFIKDYLAKLLPALDSCGTQLILCTDSAYFKVLTKSPKAEVHHGYVLPCKVEGYEHLNVVLGINHQALIYNPEIQGKLDMSLDTVAAYRQGTHQAPGTGIIHSAQYPEGVQAIAAALESLHQYPRLTCDIEAFSLRFWEAGIGTCAFAWDQHNGLAFTCDYREYAERPAEGYYGYQEANKAVRRLLWQFFSTYQGEITWHNAAYDVKVIIYTLWMQDLLDQKGLLDGLEIMTRRFQDTKLITYLATNTTAGNVLGLKPLAHEFAGNWAKDDIKDIRLIPKKELLQYNLVDCLSTWYVRSKYEPIMQADQQEVLYHDLFLPSQKLIIQMELTGMPMSQARIVEIEAELEGMRNSYLKVIEDSAIIKTMNLLVQTKAMQAANAKLKVKQHPLEKFADVKFNPNSGPQLQGLLYEQMGLPVIDLTETKQPATGAETIEKLIHHTQVPEYKELLQALINHGKVVKLLSTFIPAFKGAIAKTADGIVWLHGSFNLGGTVSGRLSSSDPNLQQIPAGNSNDELKAYLGKMVKSCFMAPKGWLFCGADFNSLEDYISALTTKDPNKLKVYLDGFDGHCLRAAFYFRDQLPDVDTNDPQSVNALKKTHPELRQESKTPTFALTYGGTYHTLMKNLGWEEDRAKRIEANYHELYRVSDEYVQERLKQANKDGYVAVAFGLRLRTPLIAQVIWGSRKMPYEAAAEGRTAGNALGQSYGLLNNRAAVEFWQKVWASPYKYDILPMALIHDAIYPLIRDNLEVVEWANRELIASMRWQELPEIQHDQVKLGAALDIFWPSWAHATTLPNDADRATILKVCQATRDELLKKAA